jgi:hypothetical protein
MTGIEPLRTAIWESERHLDVLETTLQDWWRSPATELKEFEANHTRLRILDQLIFRFTKLQDAMGQRLVPATLAAMSEPYEDWSMIDRLNRLEKLGYLEVDDWLRWRGTRNWLAHEYPEQDALRFAAILAAVEAMAGLAASYVSGTPGFRVKGVK